MSNQFKWGLSQTDCFIAKREPGMFHHNSKPRALYHIELKCVTWGRPSYFQAPFSPSSPLLFNNSLEKISIHCACKDHKKRQ